MAIKIKNSVKINKNIILKKGDKIDLIKESFSKEDSEDIIEKNKEIIMSKNIKEQKYNGWTNYETWNVSLWMDQEGMTNYWGDQINQYRDPYELSQEIKEYYEDEAENEFRKSNMYKDLIENALSNVNWIEIAQNIFDDYQ